MNVSSPLSLARPLPESGFAGVGERGRFRRHRRTKIIATLGPASSTPEVLARLFQGGADVFRLNFSHGSHEDHRQRIVMIRELEQKFGRPIGILADVQGPKLRVGRFAGGRVQLQTGQRFQLDLNPTPGDATRVNLPHPEIIQAAAIGTTLLLDDGKLRLRVVRKRDDMLETEVTVGGPLSDRKGVNVPDVVLPIPALTTKDREDLAFALDHGVDYIGLSFVQRPEDVAEARAIAAGRAWIMTKMEKPQALENLDEIVRLSDAIMVARGDLGVELPPEEVPLAQKRIVRAARQAGKPVVVATQMLESMITAPAPTRAEASDVATAVFDGADAVMLSAETAAGQFPYEAVNIMDRIVARVEQDPGWRAIIEASRPAPERSTADALAAAARQVAHTIGAAAICAFTASGSTALRASRERPEAPVISLTPDAATARRLAVVWGVYAAASPETRTEADLVNSVVRLVTQAGLVTISADIVLLAGKQFGQAGGTDALRIVRAAP
ncbi:pyruvate kinase II [Rhodovastum atsumiense]|uniref:Pyruvate kinase n=1 Tax=Rhodovastum atsumiense TaxID=504468 RepID=A0A5M6J1M6_9PROT|nr:pyruvate kinase [Rhodovastum atsumiense]KAA5614404.1 pyruvate kinase [Rhodovastum atsumiense]CAH2604883.1 pyruvate kinase II [Rhodovastum atsumiense]